jgi:hypothetical protein
MEQACGYEYNYSPKDGYCHFDHENHEDLLTTDNPNGHGYVERKVPPNWNDSGPAEGALENIQWLKQAPEPHGFFASLASLCVRAVVARIRSEPLGARTSGSGSIRRGV